MTRPKKPKIIWQVSEFGDPVHRCRYFSTLRRAIDYVFKVYPYPGNQEAYDEPCLRAWVLDDPDPYLLFVTNGALYEKSGWPPTPSKTVTVDLVQLKLDTVLTSRGLI
jgi:hypothetical protein